MHMLLMLQLTAGSQQLSASNAQAGADTSTLQSLAGGGSKESLSDKVKQVFHHGKLPGDDATPGATRQLLHQW
jgi:hypothetical protein